MVAGARSTTAGGQPDHVIYIYIYYTHTNKKKKIYNKKYPPVCVC